MIVAFVNPAGVLIPRDPAENPRPAQLVLSTLLTAAELIPVTGLDEEGLLDIPAAFTSWQVLRHGAVVLNPDGEEDPAWRRLTLETLREREDALRLAFQAAQHIGWLGQLGTEAELHERQGLPLMVTLRHPHGVTHALDAAAREWRSWLEDGPFRGQLRLIEGADLLTLLPREVNPESAVNYVLSQLEEVELSLGVSALASDAAFLALCDYAVTPGEGPVMGAALSALDRADEDDTE
ncbi:hypothetical protein DEIPH_ctg011orf0166 [Deinococcus phoenicis]|uniref:HAD family hydrolase n=1 Tax=Deinococcus phoenicis TaxID=1476583 RepID=A0A016QTS2_9DEIO|nr:hypothetical protein [Deinococcus phoenicis]EYB69179.1 hypothetical protein DEIPH_ctg011orf0166 [Deinococcus phoenicis]